MLPRHLVPPKPELQAHAASVLAFLQRRFSGFVGAEVEEFWWRAEVLPEKLQHGDFQKAERGVVGLPQQVEQAVGDLGKIFGELDLFCLLRRVPHHHAFVVGRERPLQCGGADAEPHFHARHGGSVFQVRDQFAEHWDLAPLHQVRPERVHCHLGLRQARVPNLQKTPEGNVVDVGGRAKHGAHVDEHFPAVRRGVVCKLVHERRAPSLLLHPFHRGAVDVHPLPLPVLLQVLFQVPLPPTLADLADVDVVVAERHVSGDERPFFPHAHSDPGGHGRHVHRHPQLLVEDRRRHRVRPT
mmetsp:Transcript_72324/g.145522  ORF Transcript_72324/g.145522 Transcript_72324/m.145522 type:complete len:298 (+) Transcript_72324:205-1098(+)